MKARIKKIMKKDCTTADGKKFSVLDIVCDVVVNDKGEIKVLKASMSMDYAKRYFNYCGISTKDAIGKTVEVVTAKKEFIGNDGSNRIYNYIKFLNFLNEENQPIIMPKKDDSDSIGF